MRSIFLGVALLLTTATFAQKDELKTLKKIYSKDKVSERDLEKYNVAMISLEYLAKEKTDKAYSVFYKTAYPIVEFTSKGESATMDDKMRLLTQDYIQKYGNALNGVIAIEQKEQDKDYYELLLIQKRIAANLITDLAYKFNEQKKFKEASEMFYNLYLFDKETKGRSLENAAITSFQSEDYKLAEKRYKELLSSDYLNNGVEYYAKSIANDSDAYFETKEERMKSIATGLYASPRDVKMITKKPGFYRTYAALVLENGDGEKAKKVFAEARNMFPDDADLKADEAKFYYNLGFNELKEDKVIVDEINANLDNRDTYDKLMIKRRAIFKKALPFFEKAYKIMPTDGDSKKLMNMCYDVLDMKDKIIK